MWFEFTDDAPTASLPRRLPVAVNQNESYFSAFPKTDDEGNRIPARSYAFPQKMTKSMFFKKEY